MLELIQYNFDTLPADRKIVLLICLAMMILIATDHLLQYIRGETKATILYRLVKRRNGSSN